ncbi:NACHT domain-containing protein [Sinosporangium siamense]|uniref:NACHT domain-containing protein n=1 Tax=Sinosporangium siamense TaxID=1367973 RepID=A0A919RHA9_9ACTN|nr:NACHT domain-containing protein [Sinosporangium siamense]GII93880.1 hypothetical protein Ssi02_41110 [Sinosporangium siamense]
MTRALGDPPIPVSWHMTRRAKLMDHPQKISQHEPAIAARSDDVAALAVAFRALRRRRMVITGGAGTGKTTLAIQLLLELIETRESEDPVPVLLPVADWDIEVYPRFQDWVATRVRTDYAALRAWGKGPDGTDLLARRGQILAVLDGLDELPEPACAAVIGKLSRTLGERDQVIITSRTTEYSRAVAGAQRPLRAAAVIVPRELKPEVVADYLRESLPPSAPRPWEDVLRAVGICGIRADGVAPLNRSIQHQSSANGPSKLDGRLAQQVAGADRKLPYYTRRGCTCRRGSRPWCRRTG